MPKPCERRQKYADREQDRAGAWQKQRRLSLDAQTNFLGGNFVGAGPVGRAKVVFFGPNGSSAHTSSFRAMTLVRCEWKYLDKPDITFYG